MSNIRCYVFLPQRQSIGRRECQFQGFQPGSTCLSRYAGRGLCGYVSTAPVTPRAGAVAASIHVA